MLYSHSIDDEKFNLFKIFLTHILEGDVNYKQVVDPVIEQTQNLINGIKDFYTIDRNNYPIIVFLSKQAPEYIKKLHTSEITTEDYKKILNLLSEQRTVSVK